MKQFYIKFLLLLIVFSFNFNRDVFAQNSFYEKMISYAFPEDDDPYGNNMGGIFISGTNPSIGFKDNKRKLEGLHSGSFGISYSYKNFGFGIATSTLVDDKQTLEPSEGYSYFFRLFGEEYAGEIGVEKTKGFKTNYDGSYHGSLESKSAVINGYMALSNRYTLKSPWSYKPLEIASGPILLTSISRRSIEDPSGILPSIVQTELGTAENVTLIKSSILSLLYGYGYTRKFSNGVFLSGRLFLGLNLQDTKAEFSIAEDDRIFDADGASSVHLTAGYGKEHMYYNLSFYFDTYSLKATELITIEHTLMNVVFSIRRKF